MRACMNIIEYVSHLHPFRKGWALGSGWYSFRVCEEIVGTEYLWPRNKRGNWNSTTEGTRNTRRRPRRKRRVGRQRRLRRQGRLGWKRRRRLWWRWKRWRIWRLWWQQRRIWRLWWQQRRIWRRSRWWQQRWIWRRKRRLPRLLRALLSLCVCTFFFIVRTINFIYSYKKFLFLVFFLAQTSWAITEWTGNNKMGVVSQVGQAIKIFWLNRCKEMQYGFLIKNVLKVCLLEKKNWFALTTQWSNTGAIATLSQRREQSLFTLCLDKLKQNEN